MDKHISLQSHLTLGMISRFPPEQTGLAWELRGRGAGFTEKVLQMKDDGQAATVTHGNITVKLSNPMFLQPNTLHSRSAEGL